MKRQKMLTDKKKYGFKQIMKTLTQFSSTNGKISGSKQGQSAKTAMNLRKNFYIKMILRMNTVSKEINNNK